MAENLRYGVEISTEIAQLDNGIAEKYVIRSGSLYNGDSLGGLYRWLEALNYNPLINKGLCPDGWHIPSSQECNDLINKYGNFFSIKYFGKSGLSGLNLHSGNMIYRHIDDTGDEFFIKTYAGFFTSTYRFEPLNDYYPYFMVFDWSSKTSRVSQFGRTESDHNYTFYASVRCKKD